MLQEENTVISFVDGRILVNFIEMVKIKGSGSELLSKTTTTPSSIIVNLAKNRLELKATVGKA